MEALVPTNRLTGWISNVDLFIALESFEMHGDIQKYQTVNSIVLNSAQAFYTNTFPSIEIGIIMAPNRRRVDLEGRGMKRGDVSPPTDKRTPSSETGISES